MYDNEFWKIGLMFLLILAVTLAFVGAPIYIGSCYEAKIYNQKNNTNYTCADFLWASNQINSQTQTIKIDK